MGRYPWPRSSFRLAALDRFWSKVDKTGDCWVWTGGLDTGGYGQFKYEGENWKAHRFSYFLAYGVRPKVVGHSCDNPPCVNPEHLSDGTHFERIGGLKLSQVEEIRALPMSRAIISEVSEKYNISEQAARNALNGKTWSWVPGAREVPRQKPRSALSLDDIREIKRALQSPWVGQGGFLAEKYNVSSALISQIKHGSVHSDVSIDDKDI